MSNIKSVKAYYRTRESRIGYMMFLRGSKHFGYYERGDLPFGFQRALRKMERRIGEALSLRPGDEVLDAGCGMGVVSRNLKPRGRLVQLEYSHDPYSTMTIKEKEAFKFVNKHAAMPAFDMFEHDIHEKMLQKVGFNVVSSTDCMKNVQPMLFWFMFCAWLPVKFIYFFGRERRFVNAISAVNFWRLRDKIKVKIIIAEKA